MKHRRYLEAAYTAALASPGCGGKRSRFRLGAVLINKKRIMAVKHNSIKTHPALTPFYKYPHLHAESSAILSLGLDNCAGLTLYIVRIKRDNSIALAKPCIDCMKLIQHVGIKKIIFSTHKGFEECLI